VIRALAVGRGSRCIAPDCGASAGLFGACDQHRQIPIQREFDAAVERGAAPQDPPPCFDDRSSWKEYVACWSLKEKITSRYTKSVEFCRDCSPQYKTRMDSSGRCTHRETIFVRKMCGEVIGVSSRFASRWEGSLLGLYGEVVMLPPQDAVDQTSERLAKARAPKKMGRPKKAE